MAQKSCERCGRIFKSLAGLGVHRAAGCFSTLEQFRELAIDQSYVYVDPETECWRWRAQFGPRAGQVIPVRQYPSMAGVTVSRRLLSLSLGRDLSSDEHACHTCDQPHCVNVEHLWVGSNKENWADMRAKGRHKGFTSEQAKAVRASHFVSDKVFLCVVCGHEFSDRPNKNRKVCSRECQTKKQQQRYEDLRAATAVSGACATCGKEATVTRRYFARSGKVICSTECGRAQTIKAMTEARVSRKDEWAGKMLATRRERHGY